MMGNRFIGRAALRLVAAVLVPMAACTALARDSIAPPVPAKRPVITETKAVTAYRAKLAAYGQLRVPFEKAAAAYWNRIGEKRTLRREKRARGQEIVLEDYVLDQPPVYSGPSEPPPPATMRRRRTVVKKTVPVVADFLRHARERFKFAPDRPAAEIDYKRAYARAALAAGITKEQAVRIYGFEAGGNGRHDVQAGLEFPGKKARAITTALGYNQLLTPNSIGVLAEHGQTFVEALEVIADKAEPARRKRLNEKAAALRHMIAFTRTVPNRWAEHEKLARSPQGLGVHALILDIDIGPLLQTRKLVDSLNFAKMKGHSATLTPAELEMMNLMGDGSGFDIVTLPAPMRDKVPTSNFFQRGGYERNPVVIRNNVAATLLAATNVKMEGQAALPGARELEAAFDEAGARLSSARQ